MALKQWIGRIDRRINFTASVVGLLLAGATAYHFFWPNNEIEIELQDNEIVPHCLTLHGSAPHRDGMSIMEAHHSTANRYYFNRTIRTKGDGFSMTSNIGGDSATGQSYILEVFYVSDEMTRFLLSLNGVGETGVGAGQAFAGSLPPGAENVERRTVRRSERVDLAEC
ncbi:hypothetical protein ACIBSW_08530 [Actinoplanes sp. NPDC049668]|uniref:hypothetical protein n=1 Tax=unclassified Actinoplanes TaxID=2626549 RepID=UPI0033A1E06B